MPKVLNPADIDAFRERLCDVAERLFAEHGPEAVTVRQLATELGVSAMTPYRYFADKDAMLAAVRARAFDRFAEAMEAAWEAAKNGGGGHADDAYLDFALGHPAAYRMMFDVNQPTCGQYPDLVRAMGRAKVTMGYGVREGAKSGTIKGDPELVAHMIWSMMHGAVMLELAGLLAGDIKARAIVRLTLENLRRALSADVR